MDRLGLAVSSNMGGTASVFEKKSFSFNFVDSIQQSADHFGSAVSLNMEETSSSLVFYLHH